MNILKIAFKELTGMFIDDGALALLSLLLVLGVGFAVKSGLIGPMAGAVVLIAGCLAILAESVTRAARRKVRR
ncbi:ABC-type uncharacterized transport system ATPase component [Rhizobium sp. BK529]|uniref:hypothetical protein n=1 Tax=Rhizobium sp. BK529 TaxID=2586983 RepID=UPI001607BF45|nr:hypothetical protein [Rhizobium sp. BK529]MBB3590709.1 ABC-type uncharacterized transport system ATPase component [Rhizobium sp. BK529]